MSGRRFRRAAATAALGLGAVLGALAVLDGEAVAAWSIPFLTASVLVLFELASLSRAPAPVAVIERPAVTAVVVGRLLRRAEVEGRADDTEQVIRERMAIYHRETKPLSDTYRERGVLVEVDGLGDVDEVTTRILAALT